MMNSVMATISSLVLLLVLAGQSGWPASAAAAAAAAGADLGASQLQLQLQHSPSQAEEQKQSGQLLDRLLTLAAPTTGDQGSSAAEGAERQLESLLRRAAKKQQLATKPSKKRAEHADEKGALKRKWLKLVDGVRDSDAQEVKFAVDEPQARKRHLPARGPSASGVPPEDSNQDERLALVLIKRKPQLLEGAAAQPALGSNSLAGLEAAPSGGGAQQQRTPVNMAEQQRRILEDKFGILGQSIFTTNNQLGNKGVPKFGSDEQF